MMSVVDTANIAFEQGAPFELVYTWTDDNGNPFNVTGYTAQFIVATDLINKTQILLVDSAGGGAANTSLAVGTTDGTFTVQATAAATTAMTFINGVYALIVQSSGSAISKLLEGQVVVTPGLSWLA
jgi:hypothetical protein